MQQSIVRRTIGPPGMVRHLFNVRRVSMYHDGPQCPNYDGHSSTTTELSVSFVTYHYSILTNHYCPSDGRFIGKYAYACTHCTCILLQKQVQPCWILKLHFLTLSRPISLHSHKPPGPHCFEPFTCNVYRSFQPQNMHMCKQFWGKVSTAKIFYDYQTYLWFVWFFLQNEHELKIEEIFLPWKAKHTGKIVAP